MWMDKQAGVTDSELFRTDLKEDGQTDTQVDGHAYRVMTLREERKRLILMGSKEAENFKNRP